MGDRTPGGPPSEVRPPEEPGGRPEVCRSPVGGRTPGHTTRVSRTDTPVKDWTGPRRKTTNGFLATPTWSESSPRCGWSSRVLKRPYKILVVADRVLIVPPRPHPLSLTHFSLSVCPSGLGYPPKKIRVSLRQGLLVNLVSTVETTRHPPSLLHLRSSPRSRQRHSLLRKKKKYLLWQSFYYEVEQTVHKTRSVIRFGKYTQ